MIAIVVAGVAGIVSIPVLCTLNKYQRDLRLDREPYPYSCVVEEVFKLCQSLATKLASARFLKKDCSLKFNVGRKLTDEEMPQDVWDCVEDGVNSHNVHAQAFSGWENGDDEEIVNEINNRAQVFLEGETKQTAEDVGNQNESGVITYESRPHVSDEREKSNEGNQKREAWDLGDKDTHTTIFSQRDPGEGTSNTMDGGVKSVATHKTRVQDPLEKETKKETVVILRDWEEQIMLESMRKARAQALSEIRATEFKTANKKPSDNLSLSPLFSPCPVIFYDEPENSSYIDENPAATKKYPKIVDVNNEEEYSSTVEDQSFRDEMNGTESKLADGRKGLSDEEDIYGRQDLQCIWPRKSFSDTFCCAKEQNDDKNANRRDFVRFSRRDHYEIDTNLGWGTLKQMGNKEGTAESQVEGTEKDCTARKQESEELPEKGSKKGKRRRKRRTNKRIAADVNEADDELDTDELEQGTLNTSKTPEAEHKNKQKAAELQGKITTPQKGKQPAQKLIEKKKVEAKIIEVSSAKTLRKMVNVKKKDKANKESLAQNDIQPKKPKRKLLRLLTGRKNTADCHEQKKSNNNNNRPIAKSSKAVIAQKARTTPTAHAKVEEEKDRDVMSLYDDIDK